MVGRLWFCLRMAWAPVWWVAFRFGLSAFMFTAAVAGGLLGFFEWLFTGRKGIWSWLERLNDWAGKKFDII